MFFNIHSLQLVMPYLPRTSASKFLEPVGHLGEILEIVVCSHFFFSIHPSLKVITRFSLISWSSSEVADIFIQNLSGFYWEKSEAAGCLTCSITDLNR